MGLQRLRHDPATEQQHVHWVSDAIQPSHPLWLSSPLAHNLICRADIENRRGHSGSKGCCCSVAQSCQTLFDPMDCSTPGFLVLHHLLEFAQIHVHWVGDAIQSFHPVVSFFSCPQSFLASEFFPVSWLFASDGQIIGASVSVSVLPVNIQSWFPLGLTGWISLLSEELPRVFSSTTVWKHQWEKENI